MRTRFQGWLRRAEIDRAVALSILARGWQILAAPLTLFLIARYMSPAMQGYYYTFSSLLALQSFVELGFSAVIVNITSHEWASLELDGAGRIRGSPDSLSRLISLGRLVFKWYAVASLIFVVGVGVAGTAFFAPASLGEVAWKAPWLSQVILAGLSLWLLPVTSLLEGCNQVASIQQFKLFQVVAASLGMWVALVLGAGLWAGVVWSGILLLRDVSLVLLRFQGFFKPFVKPPPGPRMSWRTEVWPMQWRLAVSGVFGYLAFSLFNPVMFRYHGATVAGQMGMTWALTNALQAVSGAWVQTKAPRFGMLIAKKDFGALDRFFWKTAGISIGVMAAGVLAIWFGVMGLRMIDHPLAHRILPPLPLGLFLLAAAVLQVSLCETVYLRAHRKEPIMGMSVVMGLAIGGSVWLLGRRFGPVGAAASYCAVVMACTLWETWIWFRCRTEWHEPVDALNGSSNRPNSSNGK
jgi:O-antigen/teichoic acid export membrane protein